ncbi:MAG: hypothetical protein ACXVA9_13050, partial [Bdellovibrionales bacterium]
MRKGLIGFLAFSVIFLNGCLEGETSNKEAKLTANQAESERLAQAGEALLTPVSFMFADELFTQALNLDSQNMRAGLYKSILGPVMKTRGFMARIAPYISTLPENIQNNYRNASARMVQADVRDFYFNGPADLKTEIDVQNLLQEVVEQFSNARKYIRANKTRVIDLKATVYSTPAASDCKVQS